MGSSTDFLSSRPVGPKINDVPSRDGNRPSAMRLHVLSLPNADLSDGVCSNGGSREAISACRRWWNAFLTREYAAGYQKYGTMPSHMVCAYLLGLTLISLRTSASVSLMASNAASFFWHV